MAIDSGERPAATAPQHRAAARRSACSRCGQCHVDSRVDEAEYRSICFVLAPKFPGTAVDDKAITTYLSVCYRAYRL